MCLPVATTTPNNFPPHDHVITKFLLFFPSHKKKIFSIFPDIFLSDPHPYRGGKMQLSSNGPNLSRGVVSVGWGLRSNPLTQFPAGTAEHNRILVPRASICGLGKSNPLSLHPSIPKLLISQLSCGTCFEVYLQQIHLQTN